MKICFVADNINPQAGLGRLVNNIADRLVSRGHEVGFVTTNGSSEHPLLEVSFRFSITNLHAAVRDLVRIRYFFKDYDVIVCLDMQPAGLMAYLATLGRGDKIVVQTLATYSLFTEKQKVKNWLIKKVYCNADRVFLINEFVKRKILESAPGFTFSKNVSFVPVGADTSLFHIKDKPSFKYAKEYILSVGAIKPRKGQLISLEAFNQIKDEFPGLNYLIVGSITDSPDYYEEMLAFISKEDIKNRVQFIQGISDDELIDLYSGAKFFVLAPTTTRQALEGFGMVYIEAALCGATAVGTLNSGAEAAIEDKKSGLLVAPEATDLAEAYGELLRDDVLRASLAKYARERALTFDWDHVVDLYESELSNIIKK